MRIHKEDGSPREPYDIVLELESRLLPMVQTAYAVINNPSNTEEAHALACGLQHYVDDVRDVRAMAEGWVRPEGGAS